MPHGPEGAPGADWHRLAAALRAFPVIPALRGAEDAREALRRPGAALLVFKGTIFSLRETLRLARDGRPVLVHLDLLEGVGKDDAGVQWLAELGVRGIASTRGHLVRQAVRRGLIAVQRVFAVDSDALATGLASAREAAPHAVEVLPGLMVPHLTEALGPPLGLPVLGAGLVRTPDHVRAILAAGAVGVSSSARELWGLPVEAVSAPRAR
jgi:glycerol uptake operon antiterminator